MGYDGFLKFDTKINESGFNSGIKKLGGIAKGGLSVLGGAVAGVAAAMGAGVVAGVKYNASIEQYQTSFEVMTGSADKAAEVMSKLKKVGAETPYEISGLANTTQGLLAYGLSADEAINTTLMLGDAAQGSQDKMDRIALAYGQMAATGTATWEDIKQMVEAGFNPLDDYAKKVGVSREEMMALAKDGKLTFDQLNEAIKVSTSEGGKYFESSKKQAVTVSGLISTLKDNAQQLLGDVVKPITESIAKDLLPSAIGAIEQLTSAFKENGVDGLIEAGGQILTNLLLGIAEKLPSVIDTAVQILQSIITNINTNLPQLLSAGGQILQSLIMGIVQLLPTLGELALNLILQLAQGITASAPQMIPKGVEILLGFISGIVDNLPKLLEAGLNMIIALAEGLINSLPTLIEQVPKIINAFFDSLDSFLPKVLAAGVRLLVELGKGIINSIPTIIANAGEIVKAILNVITHLNLFTAGKGIISGLGKGIKSMFSNIKTSIKSLLDLIKNPFKIDWSGIGKNIIDGIARGITGAASAIANAAKNAAKSALNAAKNFLGIRSPSRVFRDQVGKYMAEGMGVGFEDNIPINDMNDSLSKSVNKMQKKVGTITKGVGNTSNNVLVAKGKAGTGAQDNQPIEITNVVENVFQVDGEQLVAKTTKATIKKINNEQESKKKNKGR